MTNLDAAGMPSRRSTAIVPFQPSEADAVRMSELNVRFDGRSYRYGQYCYDVLKDALSYARLDQERHGRLTAPCDEAPVWTSPPMPTEDEQRQMDGLGVSFDGRQYHYQGYRYDRLSDALAYARRHA